MVYTWSEFTQKCNTALEIDLMWKCLTKKPDVSQPALAVFCPQGRNHRGVENRRQRDAQTSGTAGGSDPADSPYSQERHCRDSTVLIILLVQGWKDGNKYFYKLPLDTVWNLNKLLGSTQAVLDAACSTAWSIAFHITFPFWGDCTPYNVIQFPRAWTQDMHKRKGAPSFWLGIKSNSRKTSAFAVQVTFKGLQMCWASKGFLWKSCWSGLN